MTRSNVHPEGWVKNRKRKRTRRPRLARELEALPVRDALVHEEDVHLLPVDALRVFQPRERLRDGAARDGEREVSARVDGSLRVLLHLHHERDGERLLVVERLDDELAAADALDVLRAEFEVLVLLAVVVVRCGGGAEEAAAYEAALRALGPDVVPIDEVNGLPVLDLLLLGMGADGHVGSIYPGSGAFWCPTRGLSYCTVALFHPSFGFNI